MTEFKLRMPTYDELIKANGNNSIPTVKDIKMISIIEFLSELDAMFLKKGPILWSLQKVHVDSANEKYTYTNIFHEKENSYGAVAPVLEYYNGGFYEDIVLNEEVEFGSFKEERPWIIYPILTPIIWRRISKNSFIAKELLLRMGPIKDQWWVHGLVRKQILGYFSEKSYNNEVRLLHDLNMFKEEMMGDFLNSLEENKVLKK
jgi:hypothetical protein